MAEKHEQIMGESWAERTINSKIQSAANTISKRP
jgi:hypothetical protein